MTAAKFFSQGELEAIADALGHTDIGLTNPEIELLIRSTKMVDPGMTTKRVRIFRAVFERIESQGISFAAIL
ncbi:MAG: hypothetical protein ABJA20_11500, partial [Novosphingobium sp.]